MSEYQVTEEWRDIRGYEGWYQVSSTGLVRSVDRVVVNSLGRPYFFKGRILANSRNPNVSLGRMLVELCRSGQKWAVPVHRLVAEAFIGPRPGVDYHCCHNDGNPTNNNAANLRWDTRSGNTLDSVRHGTHNFGSRTACAFGHAFTDENTHPRRGGHGRKCRTCDRYRKRIERARQRVRRAQAGSVA